jgi:hypothetical protein
MLFLNTEPFVDRIIDLRTWGGWIPRGPIHAPIQPTGEFLGVLLKKQIAGQLETAENTVKVHRRRVTGQIAKDAILLLSAHFAGIVKQLSKLLA